MAAVLSAVNPTPTEKLEQWVSPPLLSTSQIYPPLTPHKLSWADGIDSIKPLAILTILILM